METGQKTIQQQVSNNISEVANHKLSIQVSLNGLSFCALNHTNNTLDYYKVISFDKKLTPPDVLDQIIHTFNSEDFLKQSFKCVSIIHDNELSTLVPKPLFDDNYLADYLKFNSKILKTDYIAYDDLLINDSVNVYVPYVNINNYFYDQFGAFEFKHASSILLEAILSLEKHSTEKKVYTYCSETYFEIVVLDKNQLILHNTFEYFTKEDFIYYTLFTLEQLELNPEEIKLILTGTITEADEIYKITYNYIRNVSILEYQNSFKVNNNINTSSLHNITLLNSF